ncbi:MAG TPA: SOS response-associated peptidase [Alphaproteobacteria bacterium]|nr:SOS response-associated peptidase [Alphaproteobacteria bacterium]
MCGRYFDTTDPARIAERFGTVNGVPNYPPHHNAAPSQQLAVVRFNPERRERTLDLLRWGLVPHWAESLNVGYKMINARAEGIAEKRSFAPAFHKRRCLVPAQGFYEWRRDGSKKRPYAIALRSGEPMAFAGLWENWKDPGGEWVRTFTIITTAANDVVGQIHDRMPVILDPADWPAWLGERPVETADLVRLLRPYPGSGMTLWPVSDRVNNARIDEPGLFDQLPPRNSA